MKFKGILRVSYFVHVALQGLLLCLVCAQLLLILHFEYIDTPVFRILEPYPRIQSTIVVYGLVGSLACILLVLAKLVHETRSILGPACKVIYTVIYVSIMPLVLLRHLRMFVKRRKR